MKRRITCVLAVFLVMLFFPLNVRASSSGDTLGENTQEYLSRIADAAGAGEISSAVPCDAEKLMKEAGVDGFSPQQFLSSPEKFLSMVLGQLKTQARRPSQSLGAILGVLVLCALLDCTREAFVGERLRQVFSGASVLFLTVSVIFPAVDCIRDCVQTVTGCSNFMTAFVPVFASVITACGLPATGSVYYLFLFSAAQVVSALTANFLVPLAGIYLALSIAGAISPGLQLGPMLGTLKSFVCWSLSFLLAGFVALLTMQSSVSSSMDAFTLKTSKMLVSSFVPVVGGALSDAISTAGGCLKLVKSAVGVYGILAAICTFIPVLLRTTVWYAVMMLGAAVGEMLSVKEASALLKAGASLMGILLAVLCLYMLLILISTTILLMAGVGYA